MSLEAAVNGDAEPFKTAVTPDKAAASLIEFINDFDIKQTGKYIAPRGPG